MHGKDKAAGEEMTVMVIHGDVRTGKIYGNVRKGKEYSNVRKCKVSPYMVM